MCANFGLSQNIFAPNLLTVGGVKPCWGLNGCASADLIPVLSSYSPNNFDVSHGSNLDLELNFNMAVELVSKKSNINPSQNEWKQPKKSCDI